MRPSQTSRRASFAEASRTTCIRRLPLLSVAASTLLAALFAPLVGAAESLPTAAAVDAQAEAVRKHPALGVAGSAFNREFLARVKRYRTEKPEFFGSQTWPVVLADEVAASLPPDSQHAPVLVPLPRSDATPPIPAPRDWYGELSAETFAGLPEAGQKLDRDALDAALLSAAIFHASNAARKTAGARPLRPHPGLREAAWEHSQAMSAGGFFSHDNPHDPAKASPSLRLASKDLVNVASGENISSLVARGHTYWSYARAVVAQWMKSPGHRANLLRASYTHLGCGAHPCRCPNFHLLATQSFAAISALAEGAPPALPGIDAPPPVSDSVQLRGRIVTAPDDAPPAVQSAVAAGNALQSRGYKFGGGRAPLEDSGYDCSGSVSYVLIKAGLLDQPRTSSGFMSYGEPGPGRWISIYSQSGHVFMIIAGVRLDTGGRGGVGEKGPRWSPWSRPAAGYAVRHPPGL